MNLPLRADQRGMSAIELLIVFFTIGALLLLVVVLIERSLAVQRARDLVRSNNVQLFVSGLQQYEVDTAGKSPAGIDDDENTWQMIGIEGDVCTVYCPNQPLSDDCSFLPELAPKYLQRIPQDPFFTHLGSSGYYINRESGRSVVTVGACVTEGVPLIEQRQ